MAAAPSTVLGTPALWVQAAAQLGVSVDALERATILGQVAALLVASRALGKSLAFKGGAVMHLIDGSPRLSADLDGVMTTGGAVRASVVRAALTTPAAKRVVIRISDIIGDNPKSLDVHFVVCRPLSRQAEITIRIQIGWRFAPLLAPELSTIDLRSGPTVQLPVLATRERAAEKVRAFTERGLPRDAFDLHYYASHVLKAKDYDGLPRLVRVKLEQGDLEDGIDLHRQFDEALRLASADWNTPRSMVLTTAKPAWSAVERALRRTFKTLLPQTLQRR